jgi:hypothetical protein
MGVDIPLFNTVYFDFFGGQMPQPNLNKHSVAPSIYLPYLDCF